MQFYLRSTQPTVKWNHTNLSILIVSIFRTTQFIHVICDCSKIVLRWESVFWKTYNILHMYRYFKISQKMPSNFDILWSILHAVLKNEITEYLSVIKVLSFLLLNNLKYFKPHFFPFLLDKRLKFFFHWNYREGNLRALANELLKAWWKNSRKKGTNSTVWSLR